MPRQVKMLHDGVYISFPSRNNFVTWDKVTKVHVTIIRLLSFIFHCRTVFIFHISVETFWREVSRHRHNRNFALCFPRLSFDYFLSSGRAWRTRWHPSCVTGHVIPLYYIEMQTERFRLIQSYAYVVLTASHASNAEGSKHSGLGYTLSGAICGQRHVLWFWLNSWWW